MPRKFDIISPRNLKILKWFSVGKTEVEIAMFLHLRGSGSISRTKDLMLKFGLIEPVLNSSVKTFRCTPKGNQVLWDNVKSYPETPKNKGNLDVNVKSSEVTRDNQKKSHFKEIVKPNGVRMSRGGDESVKTNEKYSDRIWRLHKRKFELVDLTFGLAVVTMKSIDKAFRLIGVVTIFGEKNYTFIAYHYM